MQRSETIDAERIANSFVVARRTGRALPDYPGDLPTALSDGYRIQDAAILQADNSVAGWKVGRINPPQQRSDRLAGPIFADAVRVAPAEMPIFTGGFAAVEAEFLLRIGSAPDPAQTAFTLADAQDHIDAVHIGLEIASSPFPGINDNGPAVTISDFGNNAGLVVGTVASGWPERDIRCWNVALSVNGKEVGAATAEEMLDGPFGAAAFLFEHLATRGIALRPGQWISSGAVTGVHQVRPGDEVVATFDGRLTVACSITEMG